MKVIEDKSFGIIPLVQEGKEWKVLLILHRGGRHWAFPKGHGNAGETHQQAALRELKEETGLDVEKLLLETPLVENYRFRRKNEIVSKTVYYYPAIVTGQLKLQQEEIQESKWVPLKEAQNHLTFKEARSMCAELIKILYD